MEFTNQGTWIMTPITVTAATATAATADLGLPANLLDLCLIISVTTLSGTSPKIDWSLETSPDNGTTYFTCFRGVQITATGTYRLICALNASAQNSATTATNANGGNSATVTSTSTAAALTNGCPIVLGAPGKNRIRYVLTATTPSFTGKFFGWGNVLGRDLVTP